MVTSFSTDVAAANLLAENDLAATGRRVDGCPGGRAGNALRHGLYARRVVVRAEQITDFERLRDALVAEWRPRNVTGWMLVDHLARLQWRLLRAGEAEVSRMDGLQAAGLAGAGGTGAGGLDGVASGAAGVRELSPAEAVAWDVGRAESSLARIQQFQMRLERAMHRSIGLLITLRKSRVKRGGLPCAGAVKKLT